MPLIPAAQMAAFSGNHCGHALQAGILRDPGDGRNRDGHAVHAGILRDPGDVKIETHSELLAQTT
jgi:hypothetical protein